MFDHFTNFQHFDVPAIQVEECGGGDDYACTQQANLEIFKRINALLDNSLDLSSITGLALPPEQARGYRMFLDCLMQEDCIKKFNQY